MVIKHKHFPIIMKNCSRAVICCLLVLLVSTSLFAQRIDTVVKKEVYTSYFSYQLKAPLYVVYYLYKGGGDCSRERMNFKKEFRTATSTDYAKSGYDKGHLVNAEDFAFDCDKEKCTFSFYNCIPQHPKLNRGSWKSWEATIRKESQKDILKIYAGAVYGKNKIGKGVAVPDYVWKIVYNTRTKLIMHALLFKNDASEEVQRITTSQLKQLLGYEINFNAQ
jgi:endonuclease G